MPIVETIKYEGPQDALVWRNSGKEYTIGKDGSINMGSQLIVDEFYEAILFANGNALDLFKPGRHTLITQNIPMLKEQFERLTTSTPFPVKVYFINKVHQLELKWGTQGPIMVDDPVYSIFLHVGCCGTMAIRISDSRKFLLKFVGNKESYTNNDLVGNLRGIISSKVKEYISKIMIEGRVSFFVMNAKIADIAELVKQQLQPIFDSYGLEIQFFNIETIDVPKEDYQMLQDAKNNRAYYDINAEKWEKEKMFEVLRTAAGNEGMAGNMMGAGMGLGMGIGFGAPMGQAMGNITNSVFGSAQMGGGAGASPRQNEAPKNIYNQNSGLGMNVNDFLNKNMANAAPAAPAGAAGQPAPAFCPQCGAPLMPGARFCSTCGAKIEQKNVCPACGAEVPPNAMFCGMCGQKLK